MGEKHCAIYKSSFSTWRRIPGNDGAVCAGIHGRTDAKADRREFRYAKQTVHTVVSALQKKGYLLLEASEGDKREKRIVLTESGQVYAHRMIAPLRKAEEKVYRTIGNERLQAMCEILDLFNLLFERELRGGLGSE